MVIFCSLPLFFVFRGNVQDTVSIDVEGDFDLRGIPRGAGLIPSRLN